MQFLKILLATYIKVKHTATEIKANCCHIPFKRALNMFALFSKILSMLFFAAYSKNVGNMQVILSPAYRAPGSHFGDLLAVLAVTGVVNRNMPRLWLNASSTSWVNGVPVMWPYPEADAQWMRYLQDQKNITFEVAADASICTLLGYEAVRNAVRGIVLYEEERSLDALKWVAVSAAGIYDGIPATAAMLEQHKCIAALPVVFKVPPASSFSNDLAVYA